MERKTHFAEGEYYHIFSRGVEKRKVFLNDHDYKRFLVLLYILNQEDTFRLSDFLKTGINRIEDVYLKERPMPLISILSFALMPNHFHLIARENKNGGISKFMAKLLTAYSMYFNAKQERSGPLFVRPFRSVHISDDSHFQYLFAYIHLNCLELINKDWKNRGVTNANMNHVSNFLERYIYSSYPDFIKAGVRNQSKIIDFPATEAFILRTPLSISEYTKWYSKGAGRY